MFEEVLPNGEKLTDVINKTNVRKLDDLCFQMIFCFSSSDS